MGQSWVCEKSSESELGDARLNRMPGEILVAIGERPGKSLPTAFQDWANTRAAYRFFANKSVSEDKSWKATLRRRSCGSGPRMAPS